MLSNLVIVRFEQNCQKSQNYTLIDDFAFLDVVKEQIYSYFPRGWKKWKPN